MHLLIDRLAHVVDREQRNRDAGERFHFYTRLRDRARRAFHFQYRSRRHDLDFDVAQIQIVTKRNELRRLFRCLNSAIRAVAKTFPFPILSFAISSSVSGCRLNLPVAIASRALHRFCRHIYHLRVAICADVGESLLVSHYSRAPSLQHSRFRSSTNGNHSPIRLIILPKIVLLGFSIHHIQKNRAQLLVGRARAQGLQHVELQLTAETGP